MGSVHQLHTSFFCTFGGDHLQGQGLHKYVEVIAADSSDAHQAMYDVYEGKWSFCYDRRKFNGQPEQYRLQCIGVIRFDGVKWALDPHEGSSYKWKAADAT